MLGIGLGLDPHSRRLGGRSVLPATVALAARMSVAPDPARLLAIDGLMRAVTAAGLWARLDALYLLAAHDPQAARLNWAQGAYDLTAVNSPSFTTDRGWQGDGVASYLDPGFAARGAGTHYTQNSAHMAIWSLTNLKNGGSNSQDIGGRISVTAASRIGRHSAAGDGRALFQPLSDTLAYHNAAYPGHLAWSRTAATAWATYLQGQPVGSGSHASVDIAAAYEFRLLAATDLGYGVNQIAAAHWGAGLTGADMLILRDAIRTYLVTLGAVAP